MRWREFALLCLGIAAIYVPLSLFPAPDIRIFLVPWLRHIEAAGPIAAFATPFSNYTPPYLYLLSLFSLFHLPELATIKLLSIAGVSWLAWCVGRLAEALDRDPLPAAAITLFGSLMAERVLNAAGSLAMTVAVFMTSAVVLASPVLFRQRDSASRVGVDSRASGIS